jgi:tetraacyldisaccharide 4'-kinase
LRRGLYRRGWLASVRLPVPVLVVGNLTVGGSGKTPLVIWLVDSLRQAGWHPGVISRGYGGTYGTTAGVRPESDAGLVGDEPALIARRAGCPVWVGRRRSEAGLALLKQHPEVDVIISDDGLQHYALERDIEIVVVDGQRRFGNGRLLPGGPLREPLSRLRKVDALVVNGGDAGPVQTLAPVFSMRLQGRQFWNLLQAERVQDADAFHGLALQAVAGIGNPQRFFDHLEQLGMHIDAHPFPDHHDYHPGDLPAGTVLMTEKDAVKCAAWAPADAWVLRIDACLGEGLQSLIIDKLKAHHGQQAA